MQSTITRTSTAEAYDAFVVKNYARPALTLVRGSGCSVWDDQGREYLDFTSGIGVSALGHCHPVWVEAVRRQAGTLVHVSNLFRHPLQAELARQLVLRAGPGRAFFCNSGAEANEALIKLARLHGVKKAGGKEDQCFQIIGAKDAFHGRTFGSMSATPQEKIQKGFRPLVPGFAFGELNHLQSFADLVTDRTCAILIETIQGESGIKPCTDGFLAGLRQLCDRHGLLLLIDEVQCGIGRTGRFFAFEQAGILPDAIAMAKGLGGGFPIGAVWIRENAADHFQPGSHGTTFGGTPLACAAALAVLHVIEEEKLLANVATHSGPWLQALEQLAADFPKHVKGVRGRGYMVGVQMAAEPAPYQAALREAGLLTVLSGHQVIRLLPPLIAARPQLERSVEIFRGVLKAQR